MKFSKFYENFQKIMKILATIGFSKNFENFHNNGQQWCQQYIPLLINNKSLYYQLHCLSDPRLRTAKPRASKKASLPNPLRSAPLNQWLKHKF